MIVIGETAVDYALKKDLIRAYNAGVFPDLGVPGENEDRHVSELEYRISAFDEKETYIAVKTLIKHHKKTFIKTLEYMNKEGEKENAVN